MPTRLFTIVYGDAFADLYERIAVRSLSQPQNRAAIPQDAVIALYSDAETMPRAVKAASKLGRVKPHTITVDAPVASLIQAALLNEVKVCLDTQSTLIIVNPENFWGDGSLESLLGVAGTQDVCVSAPHARVDAGKFLSCLPDYCLNNPQLVQLAMNTLHPSWNESNADHKETGSYLSGVSWRKIRSNLYAVTHLLPTVFLARFTPADYGFFEEQHRRGAVGLWDHFWPDRLAEAGRQRVIGSSDAFFLAELTEPHTHNVPKAEVNPLDHSVFHRRSAQINATRNMTAIWRG